MARQSFLEFAAATLKTSSLLKNVEAAKKKERPKDPVILNFLEVLDFYKINGREPSVDSDVNERKLANYLRAFRTRLRAKVTPYDDIGLLDMVAETKEQKKQPSGAIKSFADILKSDTHGLLAGLNTSIFDIKHVKDRNEEAFRNMPDEIASRKRCPDFPMFEKTFSDIQQAIATKEAKIMRFKSEVQVFRNMPDEIASRKRCPDFPMFEKTFSDIQQAIATKEAKIMRFKSEVQVTVGHFYVLNGILCYVAEVLDERKEEVSHNVVERANPRFRVIFDNGVETNILKRSLARALYKDPHGRIVIPSGKETPILVSETDTVSMRETGCVYILSSETNALHPVVGNQCAGPGRHEASRNAAQDRVLDSGRHAAYPRSGEGSDVSGSSG